AANALLSLEPYSFQRRTMETIAVAGIGDPDHRTKLGGAELMRVVLRQTNFDKIAHKIGKMGDYKPEIIYENARIQEVDPRDDTAIAKLNAERTAQFVTVKDDVHLAVVTRFRCLAAKLQARHPVLLKDELRSKDDERDLLQTLLVSSTNIGSLLCDGIGDAILVQGEEAPGQALRLSYNILQAAGSR